MNHLSVPTLILLYDTKQSRCYPTNIDLIKKKKIMWKDYLFTSIAIYIDKEEVAIWSLCGHLT